MQKQRLSSRLVPAVALVCGIILFINLGLWQYGKAQRRAAELEQHQTRSHLGPYLVTGAIVNPLDLQDAPVSVRGRFEPQTQFYVDNRQEGGKPGVHVVTPLHIEASDTRVLVNRGWIAWGQGRTQLPVVETPTGLVQIDGIASIPTTKDFLLMPHHPEQLPRLWDRLDLARYQGESGFAVQGFAILQTGTNVPDGLLRRWPPPEDRVAKHQSYAYQWFSMAAALLVFFVVSVFRQGKRA